MIYFAVSFALGVVFEKIFGFGWSFGVLISLVCLVLFFYLNREKVSVAKAVLILGLAFSVGVFRYCFLDVSPNENFLDKVGQDIYFEAVVSDEPDVRDSSSRYVVSVADPSGRDPESKVLLVADRFPELRYGDRIKVSGKLDAPKNFINDNGIEFDYVSYLAKDKIYFLMYRPQIDIVSPGPAGFLGTRKIVSALYSAKNIFIENISAVVPEPNSSLLSGIIFGARQSLGEDLLEDFRKAGLVHIVVLSGYNITVIAAGVFYAVSFFGKRKSGFVLSAAVIVLFAAMVGFGATVVRACIMALIALLAKAFGRPASACRWLFVAGLLMLFWNPLILFYDPSFQLSFAATLGLIIFSPFVYRLVSESKLKNFIPERFALREIVSSTVAVQLFVLPLLIKMSGTVSLISFLVNPLVLPLVPVAMGLGALTGALGMVPFLGGILSWPFGAISYLITQAMVFLVGLSVRIPFSAIQVGTIPLWSVFTWYLAYAFLFLKVKRETTLYQ